MSDSVLLDQPAASRIRAADIDPAEWQARVELAACHRLMAAAGVNDLTYNHLSARVPGEPDHYLVKNERHFFEEVTASSLLKYHVDGTKLSNDPGSGSKGSHIIHGGVLKGRPDVMAVFHTHTPANIGVSVQRFGLLPISQHAFRVHSRTAYHPFSGFEFSPDHTVRLLESLGDKAFLLMRNHGVLITGKTIPEAYVEHHNFELACKAQIAALSAGGIDDLVLPPESVQAYTNEQVARHLTRITADGKDWGALLRQAERQFPSYRN